MRSLRFVLASLIVLGAAGSVHAQGKSGTGDWPGWRGPARDNLSKETGLLAAWPKDGPTLLWKTTGLGIGYSTPSVSKGVLYVMGTESKGSEAIMAVDINDGAKLWSTPFGKHQGGYDGPRSTPTIDGDTLYVISSNGILISAKTKSGEINWKKDLRKDFAGRCGGWAYTESPLVDGDVLVCTPGGAEAPIIALNKTTGEPIWKADMTDLPSGKKGNYTTAGYASIIIANIQGVKQYVQFMNGGVVGVDAKTGKLLWHYDRPANGTANCSTAIQFGDSIFAASAYGTGGGLAKIVKKDGGMEAEEVFFLKQMENHHGGMVRIGDFLYGTNGGNLLCIDLKEGKIAWQNKCVGKGSVAFADGKLYVRGERGPIALVEVDPTKYKEAGRFDQPERSSQNAWPHPVIAGGKLYIRDQDLLLCYDVVEKK